jgi:pimeloyl-ACP methyl ester carboxylesterase/DNA-binding winged helix-turn-helix (wHTH) protein
MQATTPGVIRFDDYTLDLQQCVLRRGGDALDLRPKAFDVLRHLAGNPGRVVSKDELMAAVWPGVFVTDDALVQCVRDVRRVLGEAGQRIVKTVPRRGYMFDVATPAAPASGAESCRTADGIRLALASIGSGPPLVRPPTWFNHLDYEWHVQFRGALYHKLAEQVRLVRYDGRGNGLSERHVPEISFATFEQDLDAVIAAQRLDRYGLLGISQGAPIAIAHAARHPERVTRLVLNGGYALGRNKRGSAKDLEVGQAYLTLMKHGWGDENSAFLRTFSTLYFPGTSAEELRALAELQRLSMSADVALRMRMACDEVDVVELLPKVRAPTLVLHSRYDNAVPLEEGRRMAATIPNARFVVLESENHVPMPGEPAWATFIAEIRAFLGGE